MRRLTYPLALCAALAIAAACMPSYQYEMNKYAYRLNIIKQISYRCASFEGLVTDIEKESLVKVEAAKKIKDEQKRAYAIAKVNDSVAKDPVLVALVKYDEAWNIGIRKYSSAARSAGKGKSEAKLREALALMQASEKLVKESKPKDREEGLEVLAEATKKMSAAKAVIDSI